MIERAYALAYFILARRDLALQAAEEALARLETAMSAQDKRLYYQPTSGGDRERRSRVWLEEAQQLQRLVYVTCEPHERAREQGRLGEAVAVEDLVVHLIKHLARITVRRNAFHVVLGVCRLLFNYSTAETMDLHNLLVDRPEDVKDDSYYRARKTVLLREMTERFAGLVTLVHQHRGEERFAPMPEPQRHLALVIECLERMAPWDTACWQDRSRAAGSAPAEDLELRRIHAALHPDCLQRLVAALCLQPPQARLDLPRFDLADRGKRGDDMTDDRRRPPPLSQDDRAEIEQALRQRASARGRARADVLRIVVDGHERGRLDPVETPEAALSVGEGAEVIELWTGGPGRELLLATALLGDGGGNPPPPVAITLEDGQRLSLRVTAGSGVGGAEDGRNLTIAYRETRPLRAVQLAARRARRRAGAWLATPATRRLGWSMAGVALVGAAIFTLTSGGERPAPGQAPPLAAANAPTDPPPLALGGPGATQRSVAGQQRSVARLDLVRRIFVEPRGDERLARAAADGARARLAGSRFVVVATRDDADAVLKVEARPATALPRDTADAALAAHPARLRLRLVNADGEVLWPPGTSRGGREREGPAGATADQIVRELLAGAAP